MNVNFMISNHNKVQSVLSSTLSYKLSKKQMKTYKLDVTKIIKKYISNFDGFAIWYSKIQHCKYVNLVFELCSSFELPSLHTIICILYT